MRGKPFLCVFALVLLVPALARANGDGKDIQVEVNGSKYVRAGAAIARVSVGATDVADVAAFPPDQLLVTGKRIGQTTAAVWSKSDEVTIYTITVGYPLATMTASLKKSIAGEGIEVAAAGTSLVVRGEVRDAADVEKAEELVRGFAAAAVPTGAEPPAIVNLLSVRGDYQVQLEVSFAEVSRTALKEVGFNFWHKGKNGDYAGGMTGPGTSLDDVSPRNLDPALGQGAPDATGAFVPSGVPFVSTPMAGAFGMVFSGGGTDFPFSAALSVLSGRGYARTLSEPTLVAMSGEEATFLAGGEFPVPIPQGQGSIGIEYKKFGVQLKFTPTVVNETIQLSLAATVSDIDFGLGVRLFNTSVPGLTSRHSQTTVRMRDGQSFAIAGLLSDRVRSQVDKVPFLGELPILGMLFRSTSYRREETELLVVVTARLVRPQGERPALPGEDMRSDPSDLELFFLGTAESKKGGGEPRKAAGKPAGPVGFKR